MSFNRNKFVGNVLIIALVSVYLQLTPLNVETKPLLILILVPFFTSIEWTHYRLIVFFLSYGLLIRLLHIIFGIGAILPFLLILLGSAAYLLIPRNITFSESLYWFVQLIIVLVYFSQVYYSSEICVSFFSRYFSSYT